MSVEEVLVGLQNAIARGQSLEKAMNSLILAGYNPQEVQEAAKQVNMGIISRIPDERPVNPTSNNNSLPELQSQYKKLPAENVQQTFLESPSPTSETLPEKKKIPKWLIVTIILSALIILGIVILGLLGPKILDAITKPI